MVVVTLMGTIFYDYDILYVRAYASYEKDERESIIRVMIIIKMSTYHIIVFNILQEAI